MVSRKHENILQLARIELRQKSLHVFINMVALRVSMVKSYLADTIVIELGQMMIFALTNLLVMPKFMP